VELVADRFVVDADGRAVDLASGSSIALVTSTTGGRSEQARWVLRCDRLFRLRQRGAPRLVDYGLCGEMKRFEAWSGKPPADKVGDTGPCGLMTIARDEVRAIGELFAEAAPGPRAIAMWGPRGIGLGAAVSDLARAARMNGFVPVIAPPCGVDRRFVEVLQGRSLLLVCPGDPENNRRRWTSVLEWSLQSPRAHVVLFVGRREVPGVEGVALKRVPAKLLAESVWPRVAGGTAAGGALRMRIERAAQRAQGLPGRFAALLWGASWLEPRRPVLATRAAEQVAEYDVGGTGSGIMRVWPAPGELAALRQRMDAALPILARGCWAKADRELRQTIGRLARRHDWTPAAIGAMKLAGALVERGRPRDAQALLDDAREYARRGSGGGSDETCEAALRNIGLTSGVAWTDLTKLEDAETVLRTVVASVQDAESTEFAMRARLALARCLFWRGRFEDASRAIGRLPASGVTGLMSVRVSIFASRLAVAEGRPGDAVSASTAALESTRTVNNPALLANAACAAAFAHLAVGDHDAVDRDVALAVDAARAAHDPLRALRARLLGAESARRWGRPGPARALLARLQRLGAATLPPIVKARCDLLSDLLVESDPAGAVKHRAASSGLPALVLFAPADAAVRGVRLQADLHGAGPAKAGHPVPGQRVLSLDDSIEILQCCQSGEDERAVLAGVCARLRMRLNASAVGFFGKTGPGVGLTPFATDGRLEPAIAERIVAAGQTVGPDLRDGRIEGGAPVRYGGDVIGALVARWTIGSLGSTPDRARAGAVLAMAAVAAGPAVAAISLASQHPEGERGGLSGELAGVSQAMEDVRRAVERAGAAPFSVLIQGESGSGKELVARALHRRSPRRARPFCTLNCAALPDDLVESELFGHARGAFTGAVAERTGVFEEAHTGTLFLDEVGELSPRAQAKVLRAIQEGEIRRVGENIPRRIDVRIVSASNRDLPQEVAAGRFRLDLLYRLDVIHITLPPLRDRRDDIAVLAERYWREAAARVASRSMLGAATVAALARYDWPGNVRELQNVLASLAVRSPRSGVVPPTALPPVFGARQPEGSWRLDAARRGFEERFVRAALVRTGGRRQEAAIELGLTRQGLRKLMTRLGIVES
jgi:DNA-binding NtrC family response regulator